MGNCCCIAGHNKKNLNSNLKDRRKKKYKTSVNGNNINYGDYYDDLEDDLASKARFQLDNNNSNYGSNSNSKTKLKSKNNKKICSYIAAQADLANVNQNDKQQQHNNTNSNLYKNSNNKFIILSNANTNNNNNNTNLSNTPSRRDNSQIINNLNKGIVFLFNFGIGASICSNFLKRCNISPMF